MSVFLGSRQCARSNITVTKLEANLGDIYHRVYLSCLHYHDAKSFRRVTASNGGRECIVSSFPEIPSKNGIGLEVPDPSRKKAGSEVLFVQRVGKTSCVVK